MFPGCFCWNHQFLDGVDELLNRSVVSFQAAVQFVDFGGELAILDQHLAHVHKCPNHKNAHLDGPPRVEDGCGHDGAVSVKA